MGFFIPLAIGATKLLGGTALVGGGVTAAGVGLTRLATGLAPGLPKMLGQDLDSRGRAEAGNFDRSTGQIDYSPGDWITSLAMGQDLSQLNKSTQKASNKAILDSQDEETLISEFKAAGLDTSGLNLSDTESAKTYAARLGTLESQLDSYKKYKALGVDPSKLAVGGKLLGVGEMGAAYTKHQRNDEHGPTQVAYRSEQREIQRIAEEKRRQQEAEVRYNREYRDSQDWKRLQFVETQNENERRREDRRAERSDNLMEMRMQRTDRRDLNEMQMMRDERKDRQLMILQLLKGLGTLGQSIAI